MKRWGASRGQRRGPCALLLTCVVTTLLTEYAFCILPNKEALAKAVNYNDCYLKVLLGPAIPIVDILPGRCVDFVLESSSEDEIFYRGSSTDASLVISADSNGKDINFVYVDRFEANSFSVPAKDFTKTLEQGALQSWTSLEHIGMIGRTGYIGWGDTGRAMCFDAKLESDQQQEASSDSSPQKNISASAQKVLEEENIGDNPAAERRYLEELLQDTTEFQTFVARELNGTSVKAADEKGAAMLKYDTFLDGPLGGYEGSVHTVLRAWATTYAFRIHRSGVSCENEQTEFGYFTLSSGAGSNLFLDSAQLVVRTDEGRTVMLMEFHPTLFNGDLRVQMKDLRLPGDNHKYSARELEEMFTSVQIDELDKVNGARFALGCNDATCPGACNEYHLFPEVQVFRNKESPWTLELDDARTLTTMCFSLYIKKYIDGKVILKINNETAWYDPYVDDYLEMPVFMYDMGGTGSQRQLVIQQGDDSRRYNLVELKHTGESGDKLRARFVSTKNPALTATLEENGGTCGNDASVDSDVQKSFDNMKKCEDGKWLAFCADGSTRSRLRVEWPAEGGDYAKELTVPYEVQPLFMDARVEGGKADGTKMIVAAIPMILTDRLLFYTFEKVDVGPEPEAEDMQKTGSVVIDESKGKANKKKLKERRRAIMKAKKLKRKLEEEARKNPGLLQKVMAAVGMGKGSGPAERYFRPSGRPDDEDVVSMGFPVPGSFGTDGEFTTKRADVLPLQNPEAPGPGGNGGENSSALSTLLPPVKLIKDMAASIITNITNTDDKDSEKSSEDSGRGDTIKGSDGDGVPNETEVNAVDTKESDSNVAEKTTVDRSKLNSKEAMALARVIGPVGNAIGALLTLLGRDEPRGSAHSIDVRWTWSVSEDVKKTTVPDPRLAMPSIATEYDVETLSFLGSVPAKSFVGIDHGSAFTVERSPDTLRYHGLRFGTVARLNSDKWLATIQRSVGCGVHFGDVKANESSTKESPPDVYVNKGPWLTEEVTKAIDDGLANRCGLKVIKLEEKERLKLEALTLKNILEDECGYGEDRPCDGQIVMVIEVNADTSRAAGFVLDGERRTTASGSSACSMYPGMNTFVRGSDNRLFANIKAEKLYGSQGNNPPGVVEGEASVSLIEISLDNAERKLLSKRSRNGGDHRNHQHHGVLQPASDVHSNGVTKKHKPTHGSSHQLRNLAVKHPAGDRDRVSAGKHAKRPGGGAPSETMKRSIHVKETSTPRQTAHRKTLAHNSRKVLSSNVPKVSLPRSTTTGEEDGTRTAHHVAGARDGQPHHLEEDEAKRRVSAFAIDKDRRAHLAMKRWMQRAEDDKSNMYSLDEADLSDQGLETSAGSSTLGKMIQEGILGSKNTFAGFDPAALRCRPDLIVLSGDLAGMINIVAARGKPVHVAKKQVMDLMVMIETIKNTMNDVLDFADDLDDPSGALADMLSSKRVLKQDTFSMDIQPWSVEGDELACFIKSQLPPDDRATVKDIKCKEDESGSTSPPSETGIQNDKPVVENVPTGGVVENVTEVGGLEEQPTGSEHRESQLTGDVASEVNYKNASAHSGGSPNNSLGSFVASANATSNASMETTAQMVPASSLGKTTDDKRTATDILEERVGQTIDKIEGGVDAGTKYAGDTVDRITLGMEDAFSNMVDNLRFDPTAGDTVDLLELGTLMLQPGRKPEWLQVHEPEKGGMDENDDDEGGFGDDGSKKKPGFHADLSNPYDSYYDWDDKWELDGVGGAFDMDFGGLDSAGMDLDGLDVGDGNLDVDDLGIRECTLWRWKRLTETIDREAMDFEQDIDGGFGAADVALSSTSGESEGAGVMNMRSELLPVTAARLGDGTVATYEMCSCKPGEKRNNAVYLALPVSDQTLLSCPCCATVADLAKCAMRK